MSGVTDQKSAVSANFAAVTAKDEAAARIHALMGTSPDSDAARHARAQSYRAEHVGGACAKCFRALASGEPVYRDRVNFGRVRPAPVCVDCKSKWSEFYKAVPCEHCSRPVHERITAKRVRRRSFRCDRCKSRAASAALHTKRVRARGTRECAVCGETFEPTRADAKFCSVACKQVSYRRRVTDAKSLQRDEIQSRNACSVGNQQPIEKPKGAA